MRGDLSGKSAIVTGAAGGIGEAVAAAFALEGARVLLVDVDEERLVATTARLEMTGANVASFVADVSDSARVREMVEFGRDRLGGVDVLCNNAAVTVPKPVDALAEAEWDRVLDVDLKSVFLAVKHAILAMRERGGGTIVNVASVDGSVGERNIPAYCAAKGGVVNLTRALALDHARDNVRVNCVCPGMTDTPLFRSFITATPDAEEALRRRLERVPLRRLVEPREVAAAVLFLASDAASAVTGAALTVDAGLTAGWDFTPA